MFNEFKFTDATKAQIAGRIEQVNLRGSMPGFPSGVFDRDQPRPLRSQRDPSFTPKSISFGFIQNLPWDLVGSMTAQYDRARAEARRTILARRARRDRHVRHRQSQSENRNREVA